MERICDIEKCVIYKGRREKKTTDYSVVGDFKYSVLELISMRYELIA